MNDVQPKACAALVAPGREERIKHLTPDLRAHAAAVVGKQHFDVVLAGPVRGNADGALRAVRKGVRRGVEQEIGEHLAVRPGIAVHG